MNFSVWYGEPDGDPLMQIASFLIRDDATKYAEDKALHLSIIEVRLHNKQGESTLISRWETINRQSRKEDLCDT